MIEHYDVHIHTHDKKCHEFFITAEDRHEAAEKVREAIPLVHKIWVFKRRENGERKIDGRG
jgi:hypothetical protein